MAGPYCMAISDTSDIIYLSIVSINFGDQIRLFTSEGQFVTSFGRGSRGLAVDISGVLYVCDSNCVYLF